MIAHKTTTTFFVLFFLVISSVFGITMHNNITDSNLTKTLVMQSTFNPVGELTTGSKLCSIFMKRDFVLATSQCIDLNIAALVSAVDSKDTEIAYKYWNKDIEVAYEYWDENINDNNHIAFVLLGADIISITRSLYDSDNQVRLANYCCGVQFYRQ